VQIKNDIYQNDDICKIKGYLMIIQALLESLKIEGMFNQLFLQLETLLCGLASLLIPNTENLMEHTEISMKRLDILN
jgi:hypothetical protein